MIPFAILVIVLGFIYLRNVSDRIKTKLNILSVILYHWFRCINLWFQPGRKPWLVRYRGSRYDYCRYLALVLFSWKELRSQNPLLDLRVFKYNMFSLTTIINIAITMIMYADMMLLPLYLQNMRGFTAIESGLLLLPGALVMGFLMPVTGKLFDRFGAKWLAITGMTITIITTMGFINLTDSTSYIYLILMSTGRRIGMALMMMPIQTAGLNQLPQRLNAHGTAISNTIRQVAGAVGTSLLVTVMTSRTKSHLQDMVPTAVAKGLNQKSLLQQPLYRD